MSDGKLQGATIGSKISSGLLWSALGRVVQQLLQFGVVAVLSRLLEPSTFGLMTMVLVFTGFANLLADGGFSLAIVQRKDLKDEHCNVVFWINIFLAVLLGSIMFLLAPALAGFYKTPELIPIFRVVALNFLIANAGSVHFALLQKELRFKEIAQIGSIVQFVSGVSAVILAFAGLGVWALVSQMLIFSAMTTILRWYYVKWAPRWYFSLKPVRDIWKFSSNYYIYVIMNYWSRNGGNLLIGRFFGDAALGIYNRAYTLMILPITQINQVAAQVAFPAFSSVQDQKELVRQLYLRGIRMTSFVTFPAMIGIMVLAEPFIHALLGYKWTAAIPLLQVLAITGLMQVIGNTVGWLFTSQGRTDIMLAWGSAYSICAIVSFFIGVYFGSVMSVAVAYTVANAICFYPELNSATRLVGLEAWEVLKAIRASFFAAVVMGGLVALASLAVPSHWWAVSRLILLTTFGFGVYMALVIFFKVEAWIDISDVLRKMWKRRISRMSGSGTTSEPI
jgi:PST family polysaccharide transporter